ncbi:HAD family hydrolase [Actinomyces haliotis]|uniref:HAD family hydrolase n=1 Tax=Actinomyces haliotis TaxID=1280843 RepID=UPI001890680A|nr:HAD family hydrolase [Actinomyces haliotis]
MTRKILSTDLDGTILFDGRVRDEDLAAMRRWREAGHLLVMNTGRSVAALHSALDPSGLEFDYAVLYSGAVLTDGDYEVLHVTGMPDGVPDGVLELVDDAPGVTVFTTTLDGDLQLYDSIGSGTGLLTLFTPGTTADLAGRSVIGVPLRVADGPAFERIRDGVEQRWGGAVTGFRNQDFYDLVPAGVSKGLGLTELVSELTAPDGPYAGETVETWTVGDSWNDIPMHELADHPVAMASAPPEVVDVCECTTPSVAAVVDWVLSAEADPDHAATWRDADGVMTWPSRPGELA